MKKKWKNERLSVSGEKKAGCSDCDEADVQMKILEMNSKLFGFREEKKKKRR